MSRFRSVVLATLLALAVASQPLTVAAEGADDTGIDRWDWKKFVDYSACAVSIGFAVGTGAWMLAYLACARAAVEHWSS